MFCPQCGARTADDAAFCNNCGAALAASSPTSSGAQNIPSAYPAAASSPSPTPPPAKEPLVPNTTAPAPMAYNPQTINSPNYPPVQSTSQHYAVPKKKPTPSKKRNAPPTPTGGAKALTALLCFLFCLFFLLSSAVGITRNMLAENNITQIVHEINIDEIEIEEDGQTYLLVEFIHDSFDAYLADLLSERDLEKVLDLNCIRNGIAKFISGYTEYFISGEPMRTVDADAIISLLENCEYSISRELDDFYDPNYANVKESLEKRIDFSAFEKQEIRQLVPLDLELVRFMLSPLCYGILIFLTADFLLLLFIVNRKNLCYLLPKLSVTCIVLGAFFLLLTFGGLYSLFFPPFEAAAMFSSVSSAVFASFNILVGLRAAILLVLGISGKIISSLRKKKEAT